MLSPKNEINCSVSDFTLYVDPKWVREVLPDLYLGTRKDYEQYPEGLLERWGFGLEVATLAGDSFDDKANGLRVMGYSTSSKFSIILHFVIPALAANLNTFDDHADC